MNIDDAFPSKYVRAEDLLGMSHEVQIAGIQKEEIGDDIRPILYLEGKPKGVVLNKTRSSIMRDAWGKDTDLWVGKTIEIYPDTTMYKGQSTSCISLRLPMRAAPQGGGGGGGFGGDASAQSESAPAQEGGQSPSHFGDGGATQDGIPF